MKHVYSTIMMLAMMVAALGLTACGGSGGGSFDDDDDFGYGGGKATKTLKIDGESYYCGNGSSVEQTQNSGMYIEVNAVTNMDFQVGGKRLVMHISPSRVSQLKVGQEFDGNKISVRNYGNFNDFNPNTYEWEVISGSFVIKSITDVEMKIQFNKMVVKYRNKEVKHTIEGTAVLNSGVWKDGKYLPFSEAISSLPDWVDD